MGREREESGVAALLTPQQSRTLLEDGEHKIAILLVVVGVPLLFAAVARESREHKRMADDIEDGTPFLEGEDDE